MICPVASFMVALRLPFTADVPITPSLAALPPTKLTNRPSMPSSLNCDLSFVFTSANTGAVASATTGNATAQIFFTRVMNPPPENAGIAQHCTVKGGRWNGGRRDAKREAERPDGKRKPDTRRSFLSVSLTPQHV